MAQLLFGKEAQLTREAQLQAGSPVASGRSSRLCGSETYTRCAGIIPSQVEQNPETSNQGVQVVLPSLCATTPCPIIPDTTTHPTITSTAMSLPLILAFPCLLECHCLITNSPHDHNASASIPLCVNISALLTVSPPY